MKKAIFLGLLALVQADVYMHNPRGSNDRLNENGNRDEERRLFDSQNNGKGGYCWGDSLTYYEGSELTVEWTSQHGCGSSNNDCQLILQYMCGMISDTDTLIRDGSTTTKIPNDMTFNEQTAGVYTYGMHESYAYYQRCSGRSRNMGLFLADQDLSCRDAECTRQSPNADRHGFECAEERDYYPYWAPTPWIDIAVLTNDVTLCPLFTSESQNVASKFECVDSSDSSMSGGQSNDLPYAPLSETQCTGNGGTWMETKSWGLSAPDCIEAPFSRDNHLGNGKEGHTNHYNWTLPSGGDLDCLDGDNCVCVLRLRYNISTFDVDNWASTDANMMPAEASKTDFIDYNWNGNASPLQEDPLVDIGGFNVTLALDTTQYGRVFQDRSYTFYLKSRPSEVVTGRLFNLNVRGKRGNIVQAYPAVEYDFVPTFLEVPQGSWIHFHWTGCDTNPAGNDGEGTDQTDRSNIVQMRDGHLNYPTTQDEWDALSNQMPFSAEERLTFAAAGQTIADCPTYEELLAQNNNNANTVDQATNNCFKLNAAPRHFDGGVYHFQSLGSTYDYMCTRNNNFSNRSQKGGIKVVTALKPYAIGLIAGAAGAVALAAVLGITYHLGNVNPYSAPGKIWSKVLRR
jgi:hypothetical protein